MVRLHVVGAAAPLLIVLSCSIPVAETPKEESEPPIQIVRQTRPPLHTPAYSQALEGVLGWEAEDLAELERRVAADPQDWTARAKILAYAKRADQISLPENLERRKTHVFWLIEHDPASEILASDLGTFSQAELPPEQWQRATTLWETAAEASSNDRVLANAANFFTDVDSNLRRLYLERAAEAAPENAWHGTALGILYGETVIQSMRKTTPEALRLATEAEEILTATNNAAMVEAAVRVLTSYANSLSPVGRSNTRASRAAERLFPRAKALNPDLDEEWVHPKPAVPEERFHHPPTDEEIAKARARVVRLKPSDFPELPAGLADLLTERQCGIPQVSPSKEKNNLVQGEFFEPGKMAWAVICSVDGQSETLVFRSEEDRDPVVLRSGPDPICLAEEWNCGSYLVKIGAVDREFILDHYRAYGGPKPPPIDHHGLDIALVGKGSVVRYFHNGEWLSLAGAD